MHPKLLENRTLQIGNEIYQSWPFFRPLGSKHIGGLWRAHYLYDALTMEDLNCAAWRSQIPSNILRTLQEFPECHCELIAMAQTVPELYLRLVNRSPAMTLIAATYWIYRYAKRIPKLSEKENLWDNFDPRMLLSHARFPCSKSFLKALSKIPENEVYAHRVMNLRDLWAATEKRGLLQHLPTITGTNLWLLSCYPAIIDPSLHRLAADHPSFGEYTIEEVVSDLANRREIAGLDHWPYRNRIHSWDQLLEIYNRFLRKVNCAPETFPEPPVAVVEDANLHIVPIRNRTALRQESAEMSNCIESFCADISSHTCYAYKLLRPERATILIKRQWWDRWMIQEAMLGANEREVRPGTMRQLVRWVRSHRGN